MTTYHVATICSHSVAIAAIAGVIRFKNIQKQYHPFLIFLVVAAANEIASTVLIYLGYNNGINGNLYVLAEFILIMHLFRTWNNILTSTKYNLLLIAILLLVWIIDNFIVNTITTTNALFRLCYSFLLVFLSVEQISHVLITERRSFKDPRFTICSGFILYYTFRAILESFFLFDLGFSNLFYEYFLLILVVINLLANLIYLIAVLWIPTKQTYSTHYS